MLLFVNECFPKRCTLSGATDCLFIHPSVCPLRFALMGQKFVSVWQIHFKKSRHTYTLGLGDDAILNANLICYFRYKLILFIYFFGHCLNRCSMNQYNTSCKLIRYRCPVHKRHNSSMLSIVFHLWAWFQYILKTINILIKGSCSVFLSIFYFVYTR